MKRILIAVAVALAVFGGTFAFAASLGGVTTGSVGDSAAVVASCDTDGVTTAFSTPSWDATDKHYDMSSMDITGINAACDTHPIRVTLTDSTGASLGEATGTVGSVTSGQATVTFASPVYTQDVEGVEVVISS